MASKGVLVTRPLGQGDYLCGELGRLGFCVHHQPLLELRALDPSAAIEHCVSQLDSYRHIIFISGNAVRYGMTHIAPRWPRMPVGSRVYAIGSATTELLRPYAADVVCTDSSTPGGAMTSESLLALASLADVAGQKVLLVKGEGGRSTLRDTLRGRGAKVDELVCYQRRCPRLPPGELARKIADWQIELILISSGEGFSNMLALLSPKETIKLYSVPLVVPSRRVARMAQDAGFAAVHAARNATDQAMLEVVQGLQL